MEREELSLLSEKYLAGEASEEEISRLLDWYNNYDEQELTAIIADDDTEEQLKQRMHQRLMAVTRKPAKVFYTRWWAAAAVMLVLAVVGWLWSSTPGAVIIAPGVNMATLTLADGSVINLDSTGNGMSLKQGHTKVEKTANGEVVYKSDNAGETSVGYNVLSTPRGGQFKVVLPDGSAVWLNAASSIRYPTAFTGKERRIVITGEAYFEVAKNASAPFIVSVNNMKVTVLGTHFNINAYNDETVVKTTLLEGAVKVSSGSNISLLKPNQQAQVNYNGEIRIDKDVDVMKEVAWKDGFFRFKDENIKTIMKQLSRWYNIDVEFEGNVSMEGYSCMLARNIPISTMLETLKETGRVHFSINGNKIKVLP
jgi:ferric-dicitrate binding protein FerR (iron transport regulator)